MEMPKYASDKKRIKYRPQWETIPDYSKWLAKGKDEHTAFCKACCSSVLSRMASIKQHASSQKHAESMENYIPAIPTASSSQISYVVITNQKKEIKEIIKAPKKEPFSVQKEILKAPKKDPFDSDDPLQLGSEIVNEPTDNFSDIIETDMKRIKFSPDSEKIPDYSKWLAKGIDKNTSFCKACGISFSRRIQSIKQHAASQKHAESMTLLLASEKLNDPSNVFSKIGEVWALKLNAMDPTQALYAEKKINDIIFQGQLGNLQLDIDNTMCSSTSYLEPIESDGEHSYSKKLE